MESVSVFREGEKISVKQKTQAKFIQIISLFYINCLLLVMIRVDFWSLSREYCVWDGNTAWMGHQSNAGHEHIHTFIHTQGQFSLANSPTGMF